jgi:hypothetical protein
MASASGKVAPGFEEDEAEDDEFNVGEEEGEEAVEGSYKTGNGVEVGSSKMKYLVKKVLATQQVNYFQSLFDYNSIKANMRWFMETATCTISFTVSGGWGCGECVIRIVCYMRLCAIIVV